MNTDEMESENAGWKKFPEPGSCVPFAPEVTHLQGFTLVNNEIMLMEFNSFRLS